MPQSISSVHYIKMSSLALIWAALHQYWKNCEREWRRASFPHIAALFYFTQNEWHEAQGLENKERVTVQILTLWTSCTSRSVQQGVVIHKGQHTGCTCTDTCSNKRSHTQTSEQTNKQLHKRSMNERSSTQFPVGAVVMHQYSRITSTQSQRAEHTVHWRRQLEE